MKTLIKTQMRNELIGQAILALIVQKSPISEHTLQMQLRNIQKRVGDPVCQEVLRELIAELVIRTKKVMSGVGKERQKEGSGIGEYEPDDEKQRARVLHKIHKLH